MKQETKHVSVLLQQAVTALNIKPGNTYIDVTLGGAGHTREILKQMQGIGTLIVFDQDENPVQRFEAYLKDARYTLHSKQAGYSIWKSGELKVIAVRANFNDLTERLSELNIKSVNGILADLGLSTDQLADEARGFGFQTKGKLDMRMNPDLKITAADLVNGLFQKELEVLFTKLGDIEFSAKLSRAIIKARNVRPITRVADLRQIVQKIVPLESRKGTSRHPEAKVFQALRIAVNDELSNLKSFLPQAFKALASEGRLVILTFHSGEDRITKLTFRDFVETEKAIYIHKILKPDAVELEENSRSHSAKLRALEKK